MKMPLLMACLVPVFSQQANLMLRSCAFIRQRSILLKKRCVQYFKQQASNKDLQVAEKDLAMLRRDLETVVEEAGQVRNIGTTTKGGFFSHQVTVEKIINNHYGKKSFAEAFFEWISHGRQQHVFSSGVALGAFGGYGWGRFRAQRKE